MGTKRLTCAAAGLVIALCSLSGAFAQTAPDSPGATVPTNLPGIRAHVQPPAGFNPLTASAESLQTLGYPPKPDPVKNAAAFKVWAKAVSAPQVRIIPQLQQTDLRHGPARIQNETAQPDEAQAVPQSAANVTYANSTNWSGIVLYDGTHRPFASSYVYSYYTIPRGQQAFGLPTGSWDWSSQWVGIDGFGSGDVLQAGTEADAYADSAGNKAAYYAAWFEWYPFNEVRINNFPVNGGDVMFVDVWNTSATDGYAYLADLSTNQVVSVSFTAPAGTTLIGNSMEWVVERPTVGGVLATLTNYVACPFDFTYGANASTIYYPGMTNFSGTMYNVTMVNNNSPISYCYLLGPALWFMDTGSAH
ncbi:MAG: hypothetical protein JOY92_15320 [Verrucomicrobia bacterium]|nr:hypothetical protein [Verrucomicrobiota bacterium]